MPSQRAPALAPTPGGGDCVGAGGLPSLETLELHRNRIGAIPADYFVGVPALQRLVPCLGELVLPQHQKDRCTDGHR